MTSEDNDEQNCVEYKFKSLGGPQNLAFPVGDAISTSKM